MLVKLKYILDSEFAIKKKVTQAREIAEWTRALLILMED